MTDQLKLMVGASGAIVGLIVGIGIGLIVNSGGGGVNYHNIGGGGNATSFGGGVRSDLLVGVVSHPVNKEMQQMTANAWMSFFIMELMLYLWRCMIILIKHYHMLIQL